VIVRALRELVIYSLRWRLPPRRSPQSLKTTGNT
jgi:hypothetical protein